jgi:hypothetical protein
MFAPGVVDRRQATQSRTTRVSRYINLHAIFFGKWEQGILTCSASRALERNVDVSSCLAVFVLETPNLQVSLRSSFPEHLCPFPSVQLNQQYDPDDGHHIVRLLDHFVHQKHLCLVFELLTYNL